MKPARTSLLPVLLCLSALFLIVDTAYAADHRLGGGVRYFRTIDDLDDDGFDDLKDSGFAYVGSYQYVPKGLFRFELNLEYFPDGFGGSTDSAISPQALVLVGKGLYGGVGIGQTYASSFKDDLSEIYYLARVGFDLQVLPNVFVDLNLNYQANAFDELGDASTDAITFGAMARIGF